MKVTELFETKISTETLQGYLKRLFDLKLKQLGYGRYARVFQHPELPDVAVKIYSAERDDGYKAYLQWCLKNQSNKFVPKVLSTKKFDVEDKITSDYTTPKWDRWKTINIVFLEKLKPISKEEYVAFEAMLCKLVGRTPSKPGRELGNLDPDDWKKIETTTKDKDLAILAAYMSKNARYGLGSDINKSNVMTRANGQVVITDPFPSNDRTK